MIDVVCRCSHLSPATGSSFAGSFAAAHLFFLHDMARKWHRHRHQRGTSTEPASAPKQPKRHSRLGTEAAPRRGTGTKAAPAPKRHWHQSGIVTQVWRQHQSGTGIEAAPAPKRHSHRNGIATEATPAPKPKMFARCVPPRTESFCLAVCIKFTLKKRLVIVCSITL